MSRLRDTLTPQTLALHDAMELIPESSSILREDIEDGRVVIVTEDVASQTAQILTEKAAQEKSL